MKMKVTGKYLVLPVNNDAQLKNIRFSRAGRLVFDLNVKTDPVRPFYFSYTDFERFIGEEFDIELVPEAQLTYSFTDKIPTDGLYKEPYRPKVHLSPLQGWMNDPNGLIFIDGVYHYYYQHNPCANQWGNMTWGHAVSSDLLHWEEKGDVLFPDEHGTMYSGSAIYDEKNLSGLGEGGKAPILFFYTASGGVNALSEGQQYTQCLAYSNDGGYTLKKYGKNPIIGNFRNGNRDPKVIWCDEIGRYIMSLYFIGNEFALFASDNLVEWELLNEFTFANDNECPDCYPLSFNGKRIWVFTAAHGRYALGRVTDKGFEAQTDDRPYNYGNGSYAAQTFSGINDRRIKCEWGTVSMPGERFRSQEGFPREMLLCEGKDGGPVLASAFIPELSKLFKDDRAEKNITVSAACIYKQELENEGCYVEIKAPYEGNGIRIRIFGQVIDCDFSAGKVYCADQEAPVYTGKEKLLDIKLIADTAGIEMLLDGGRIFFSVSAPRDFSMPYISLEPRDGNQHIDVLRVCTLGNIWTGRD